MHISQGGVQCGGAELLRVSGLPRRVHGPISARHVRVDGATVGCHRSVSLYLRGASRQRPPSTPRAPARDLTLLLDALSSPPFEPLAQVGLKWLSTKAAFLLTIASGKRVGGLHALSVSDACLRWDSQVLPFGQMWQPVQLARFDIQENSTSELLCPVGALRAYIDATACIRQSLQLFVYHGGTERGWAL